MTTTGRQNVATRRKKGTNWAKNQKNAVPKRDLIKTENSKPLGNHLGHKRNEECKLMVSRNNDFSLHKYVFGLILVELKTKILNAQERGHQGHEWGTMKSLSCSEDEQHFQQGGMIGL